VSTFLKKISFFSFINLEWIGVDIDKAPFFLRDRPTENILLISWHCVKKMGQAASDNPGPSLSTRDIPKKRFCLSLPPDHEERNRYRELKRRELKRTQESANMLKNEYARPDGCWHHAPTPSSVSEERGERRRDKKKKRKMKLSSKQRFKVERRRAKERRPRNGHNSGSGTYYHYYGPEKEEEEAVVEEEKTVLEIEVRKTSRSRKKHEKRQKVSRSRGCARGRLASDFVNSL